MERGLPLASAGCARRALLWHEDRLCRRPAHVQAATSLGVGTPPTSQGTSHAIIHSAFWRRGVPETIRGGAKLALSGRRLDADHRDATVSVAYTVVTSPSAMHKGLPLGRGSLLNMLALEASCRGNVSRPGSLKRGHSNKGKGPLMQCWHMLTSLRSKLGQPESGPQLARSLKAGEGKAAGPQAYLANNKQ